MIRRLLITLLVLFSSTVLAQNCTNPDFIVLEDGRVISWHLNEMGLGKIALFDATGLVIQTRMTAVPTGRPMVLNGKLFIKAEDGIWVYLIDHKDEALRLLTCTYETCEGAP